MLHFRVRPLGCITPESLHFQHHFAALTNQACALELPTQVFERADLPQDDDDLRLAFLTNAFVDDVHADFLIGCTPQSLRRRNSLYYVKTLNDSPSMRLHIEGYASLEGSLTYNRAHGHVFVVTQTTPSCAMHQRLNRSGRNRHRGFVARTRSVRA